MFAIYLIFVPIVCGLDGKQLVDYAVKQYSILSKDIINGIQYPAEGEPMSKKWNCTGSVKNQWTAGFYPGVLWYLFKYTNNENWKQLAIKATNGLHENQFRIDSIDIGFMVMCSYGKGYEFTRNANYSQVIVKAANSLSERFDPQIGCTRSWDRSNESIVIADNIMDLEVLFEGWKLSSNTTLLSMAVSHTNQTIKYHLRPDFSHYQCVAFNQTDGTLIRKFTAQGYADWSCWAQSQAWLINGLTMAYRYTKSDYILRAAEGVANYFIDHLPSDGIPFWDFNVPHDRQHPYIPRDSSAASIAVSGLIELFGFTQNRKYSDAINRIMNSLYSHKYRADGRPEYKIPALIVNGTADYNTNRYDRALIFGDYYFIKSFAHFLK